MRLLAITPISVSAEELQRRQERYDRLAPAGLRVQLENLPNDLKHPVALETAADIRASEAALVDEFSARDAEGWDGFLPDCVLDPVVEIDHGFTTPVFGIARLTAHFLAGLGVSVGGVARNEAIATELDRKFTSYGLPPAAPGAVLDLSVEDIAHTDSWADAVMRTVSKSTVDVIFNACSAVDVTDQPSGPTLIDPTSTALKVLALRGSILGERP